MHPMQDYFWKVFHKYYNLICIFICTPICTKNFILAKSGCYKEALTAQEEKEGISKKALTKVSANLDTKWAKATAT
jgi:hypothetical protein